jgi:hypothetical protein
VTEDTCPLCVEPTHPLVRRDCYWIEARAGHLLAALTQHRGPSAREQTYVLGALVAFADRRFGEGRWRLRELDGPHWGAVAEPA